MKTVRDVMDFLGADGRAMLNDAGISESSITTAMTKNKITGEGMPARWWSAVQCAASRKGGKVSEDLFNMIKPPRLKGTTHEKANKGHQNRASTQ